MFQVWIPISVRHLALSLFTSGIRRAVTHPMKRNRAVSKIGNAGLLCTSFLIEYRYRERYKMSTDLR